jgi:hypothetical protein
VLPWATVPGQISANETAIDDAVARPKKNASVPSVINDERANGAAAGTTVDYKTISVVTHYGTANQLGVPVNPAELSRR